MGMRTLTLLLLLAGCSADTVALDPVGTGVPSCRPDAPDMVMVDDLGAVVTCSDGCVPVCAPADMECERECPDGGECSDDVVVEFCTSESWLMSMENPSGDDRLLDGFAAHESYRSGVWCVGGRLECAHPEVVSDAPGVPGCACLFPRVAPTEEP